MEKSQKKTYLVTGAAGFIGAAFVKSCQNLGISVLSVDQKSCFQTREEIRHLQFGNIIDLEDLLKELHQNTLPPVGGIVHLGAMTDTREMDWELLTQLNIEYSKSVWNYASKNKIPLVYASSAATYGDGALGYMDDETLIPHLKPLNPYGDSKQQFDLWALEQEEKGNHPPHWAGFKFFNVYGFGERHKGFMSSVVLHAFDQIQKTEQVTLFKSHREGIQNGHQKRDFIYVEDVVDVLHFALQKPISRGIYNLGTAQARTFLDLARSVFTALKKPEKIQFMDTPLSIRDKYQYFTEARMKKLISQGYDRPFTSLEDGIKKYVDQLLD